MDSIFSDEYILIVIFSYIPVRGVWFCADLFTKSTKMLVLAVARFSSSLQRRCLVKGTCLSPIILYPMAIKKNTRFHWIFLLKSERFFCGTLKWVIFSRTNPSVSAGIASMEHGKIPQPHLSSSLVCITYQVHIDFYGLSFITVYTRETVWKDFKKNKASTFLGEKNPSTFKRFIL